MELPPSSRRPATVHQTVASGEFESQPSEISKTRTVRFGFHLFGGDWGTRTLDLMRVKHAL